MEHSVIRGFALYVVFALLNEDKLTKIKDEPR